MAAPDPATKTASKGLSHLIDKSYQINIDGHVFKIPAHPISGFCYMRNKTISAYRAVLSGKYTAREEAFLFGVKGSVVSDRIESPVSPPASAPIISPPVDAQGTPPESDPHRPPSDPSIKPPRSNPPANLLMHPSAIEPSKAKRPPEGSGTAVGEIKGERSTGTPATTTGQATSPGVMKIDTLTNGLAAGVARILGLKRERERAGGLCLLA